MSTKKTALKQGSKERKAIVAYLREFARNIGDHGTHDGKVTAVGAISRFGSDLLIEAANDIENGDHLK